MEQEDQGGEDQEKEETDSTDYDLRATFIRTTPVDGTLVLTQEWSASWTFRNTGRSAWPSGVRLVACRERDKSFSVGIPSQSQVKPGDTHTFQVCFKMKPNAKPRYCHCPFELQVSDRLSGQYHFARMHRPFLAFFYAGTQPVPKELAMQHIRVSTERTPFIVHTLLLFQRLSC